MKGKQAHLRGLVVRNKRAAARGLMGAGDTKKPMYIAILTQIVILLGVCEIYYRLDMLTTSAIWSAILISHVSRYVLTHIVFQRASLIIR